MVLCFDANRVRHDDTNPFSMTLYRTPELPVVSKISQKFLNQDFVKTLNNQQSQAFARIPDLGKQQLIDLVDLIQNSSNSAFFETWLAGLNCSQNWSEFLVFDEVNAVLSSLRSLRDSPSATNAWLSLVRSHTQATGHMQYAALWKAFKVILEYAQSKSLTIDYSQWIHYLTKQQHLHGVVLCGRIYQLLKLAELLPETYMVQKSIFDNFAEIDWRRNGLYYAAIDSNRYFLNLSSKCQR